MDKFEETPVKEPKPRKHRNTNRRKVLYWLRRHADKLSSLLKRLETK